jgi:hypothetical protein
MLSFGRVVEGLTMTPEEAAKKITEAVQALESGTHEESKAAFEFLRAVPEEYRVALDAFRGALKSSSADARTEAAAALAKLGRGEAWVLPALEEAYVGEENEFVRGRLAFSPTISLRDSAETAAAPTPDGVARQRKPIPYWVRIISHLLRSAIRS